MSFEIHHGDALTVLRTMTSASVHCAITSPPYWALRDYGTASWEGGDVACDHKQEKSRERPELKSGDGAAARADGSPDDSPFATPQTLGWQPSCKCGQYPVPATVLDPFAGSGTTGLAALKQGRSFIGIELSQDYIEIAYKRLREKMPLFGAILPTNAPLAPDSPDSPGSQTPDPA